MKTKSLVECASLGIRTTEATARKLDRLVKQLPRECRQVRRKALATDLELSEGERADISVVNTAALDRDREIVRPEGIDLDEFRANPIVLFNHDPVDPIARCLWIKSNERGLVAKTHYPQRPKGHTGEWRPDTVFGLVQAGVLKGKSISYLPLEIESPGEGDPAECVGVVTKATLLEYSVVSIPCNPEALLEAVSKGLGGGVFGQMKKVGRVKRAVRPGPRPVTEADVMRELRFDPGTVAARVREALRDWGRV